MDYAKAVRYLDRSLIFGIKPSLVRIQKIMELMQAPHLASQFIHIVGTNGKTSTTKMTAAILCGQGISCGYHISPHISSYTERFWYNGRDVTQKEFLKLFELVYPFVQKVNKMDLGGPVTQFEIIAAMGFLMAREMGLEVMVLEAGMGGRWDATNVASSKVVGLTGVSLEHTQILGNSISEIATEKAQVIKRGAAVATLSEDCRVLQILESRVLEQGGTLFVYGKDFEVSRARKKEVLGWELDIKGMGGSYKDISLPLMGRYQPKNLALAVALSELYQKKKKIDELLLRESMENIKIKGRFEVISEDPLVIADASHNPEGIDWFAKNLGEYFSDRRKIIIFAVLKDKDYRQMVSRVVGLADILIITSSGSERSLGIDVLKEEVMLALEGDKTKTAMVYKIDSIQNSLNYTLKISESNDIICITGSITNLEHIV